MCGRSGALSRWLLTLAKHKPPTTPITKISAYTADQFRLPGVTPNAVIKREGDSYPVYVVREKNGWTGRDVINVYPGSGYPESPAGDPSLHYDLKTRRWTDWLGEEINAPKVFSIEQWHAANQDR